MKASIITLSSIMKKTYISIITLALPIIVFGQNYSKNRIEKLISNLTELSTDFQSENIVGSEFVKDTTYFVFDNWTDVATYKNKNFVDNKAHKVFLKIVKKAKRNDLMIMTESDYPNIRVYGFWALIKRNEKELIERVLVKETERKKENILFDSFGDLILDFTTIQLMNELVEMENYRD
jgi:hypothetical protein